MAKTNDNSRSKQQQMLGIVVVESHQCVLEHIHMALRRHRHLYDWTMVHFDSHADLACPNQLPAALCFLPRGGFSSSSDSVITTTSLYEHLESTTTGVAEWILPLVLAANLVRIEWIRPHRPALGSASSFAAGPHSFTVGVWIPPSSSSSSSTLERVVVDSFVDLPEEARLKVDSESPYYADDDAMVGDDDEDDAIHAATSAAVAASYCASKELLFPKTVNLHVHEEWSSSLLIDNVGVAGQAAQPWLLDVCLDYFCCSNPFWVDLQLVDPQFTNALTRLVHESSLNNNKNKERQLDHDERCERVKSFRKLVTRLVNGTITTAHAASDLEETKRALLSFYTNPESIGDCIASLQSCLLAATPCQRKKLVDMAVEALPYLTLPHDHTLEVEARLEQFASFLEQQKCSSASSSSVAPRPPFLVTIARSSQDGFISKDLADELQQRVCQLVHDTYCACGREVPAAPAAPSTTTGISPQSNNKNNNNRHGCCKVELVLDYSEDLS